MDEIHQAPYSGHLGYQKTIAIARKHVLLSMNEKGHGWIYFKVHEISIGEG